MIYKALDKKYIPEQLRKKYLAAVRQHAVAVFELHQLRSEETIKLACGRMRINRLNFSQVLNGKQAISTTFLRHLAEMVDQPGYFDQDIRFLMALDYPAPLTHKAVPA